MYIDWDSAEFFSWTKLNYTLALQPPENLGELLLRPISWASLPFLAVVELLFVVPMECLGCVKLGSRPPGGRP